MKKRLVEHPCQSLDFSRRPPGHHAHTPRRLAERLAFFSNSGFLKGQRRQTVAATAEVKCAASPMMAAVGSPAES